MTSKEFVRRCEFYAVFDSASKLFLDFPLISYVYKYDIYNSGLNSQYYFPSEFCLSELDSSLVSGSDLIYIEKFTRTEFVGQFRYFLSFLSRLSERQMSSLVSSGRFNNLLRFKDEVFK